MLGRKLGEMLGKGKIFRMGFILGASLVVLFIRPVMSAEGEDLVIVEDRGVVITLDEAQRMVNYVSAAQKEYLLADSKNMQEFLLAKMTQKVIVEEALIQGLETSMPDVEWDLEETRRTILSTAVIEQKRLSLVIPENIKELAREYYITHQSEFIEDDSITVAHILLRSDASNDAEKKALADQVLQEIEGGLSFEEAARQYSEEESTAQSDGVLGTFGRGQLVAEFEAAAFALEKEGDISSVVKTQFGYHIIKSLADRNPGNLLSYEEVDDILVKNETDKYVKLMLTQYAETFQRNEGKTLYMPALEQLVETMLVDMALSEPADQ